MSEPKSSRLVEWVSPRVFARAVAQGRYRNGLELLRAIMDGELPAAPIAALLDYGPTLLEEGRAVFAGRPQEFHYNPLGIAHGGLAATMLDTAMACAIHTRLPIEVGYTTLELKVNYIRPMTVDTGTVRADGRLLHLGGRTATADGKLLDEQDRLLAHGTTTCLILR